MTNPTVINSSFSSRQQTTTVLGNVSSNILPTYTLGEGGSRIITYFNSNKYTLCPSILKTTKSKTYEEALQSTSVVHIQDLICEGPIFGLIDDNGSDLILFDNAQNNEDNLKGVFFNDVPVKNSFNNTLNYNRVSMIGKVGSEFQNSITPNATSSSLFSTSSIGITTSFDKNLYNLSQNIVKKYFTAGQDHLSNTSHINHLSYFARKIGQQQENYGSPSNNLNLSIFNDGVYEECFGVTYEVKDENADFVVITLKVNGLYQNTKKGTERNSCFFGIKLGYKQNPDFNCYLVHRVVGIATSPYQFDLVFDIKDFNKSGQLYFKIYNFTTSPGPTNQKAVMNVGIASITEIIDSKFKYPNSAYYYLTMDARGFGNIPTRSYNLKLLQIKVPENYDSDAKTYSGFWSGEFDALLRWTDNPAWILYDLVTNNKYGVGKFNLPESLVDKWSLYQIGKYCDDLVPTFNNTKYPMVTVASIATDGKKNIIRLQGSDLTSDQFPVGSLLCLTNLKFTSTSLTGETETIIKSFRKRILSATVSGNTADLLLCNDFGLHKTCSEFGEVKTFIQSKPNIKTSDEAFLVLLNEITNLNAPLSTATGTPTSSLSPTIPIFRSHIYSQPVFDEDEIRTYQANTGSAAVRFLGYLDIVEPRFTANLLINSETDVSSLVNNFASIFKGLVYWSSDYLRFDNDRPKEPVYFFNNSNVKDGVFVYSGSSKDTRYTVAKITYSDLTDGYKDKTIYVEDKINIRKFGYVEKDLLGFGVTSKSQAKRLGEWFLVTNQIEQDLISFQAGPEAMLLNPGDIINVCDSLKLSNRFGGRVVSVNNSDEVILDNLYDFIKVGDSISFIIPKKSTSVNELNDLSKTPQSTISDSQISDLSTTYIYTFVIQSVGKDGNFRTKITLNKVTEESQTNFETISESSLWIYEKSATNTSSSFNQKYRVLGIKENSPVEYEISAVEYIKNKFNYIDNRDNLSSTTIYSNAESNQSINIPRDILSLTSIPVSRLIGNDGIVSQDSGEYFYDQKYDYILNGIDYSDSQIKTLFSVNAIDVRKIIAIINEFYSGIKDTYKGLLIEYVLNSKKVSFKWHLDNPKTIYKIAVPKIEKQNTLEFIRAYPLGPNDSFI